MSRPARVFAVLLGAGALAMLSACADTIVKILGPENNVQITNTTDAFRFQAWDLDNVHDEVTETWSNTGPRAQILHRNFVHHGSGRLTILDADSVLVHESPLEYQLDLESSAGTPGDWTVTIEFFGAKGRVDVQLSKLE
jgi:hypothetical protein